MCQHGQRPLVAKTSENQRCTWRYYMCTFSLISAYFKRLFFFLTLKNAFIVENLVSCKEEN